MSAHETVYSVRVAYPDYLERGRTQTVSISVYRSGALVAPSAGTVALYDPAGNLLDTGSVSVVDSVATYSLTSSVLASTLVLGHGYYLIWTLTLGGLSRAFRRDAALVLHAAVPTLTDADLTSVYSDLSRHLASGTTSFQTYIDEAWKRILGRLESQGVYPDHVVTYWALREVHMELTYSLICMDFARAQGGRWLELADQHKKEFELAWSRLRFERATSTSAADGDGLHPANKGVTYTNASPCTSWGGRWGIR